MSVADELLKANTEFVKNFNLGDLAVKPRRRVAVLACMDSRILFERCLGLHPGDAHMIRNAGGIATDDALRSLIVSHHLLDTQEFIIINHTDCGLLKVKEDELRSHLTEKMGTIASEPAHFYAFDDLEANLRQQVQRVKSHPWIPKHIPVRGFIYDVKTGALKEVEVRLRAVRQLTAPPSQSLPATAHTAPPPDDTSPLSRPIQQHQRRRSRRAVHIEVVFADRHWHIEQSGIKTMPHRIDICSSSLGEAFSICAV